MPRTSSTTRGGWWSVTATRARWCCCRGPWRRSSCRRASERWISSSQSGWATACSMSRCSPPSSTRATRTSRRVEQCCRPRAPCTSVRRATTTSPSGALSTASTWRRSVRPRGATCRSSTCRPPPSSPAPPSSRPSTAPRAPTPTSTSPPPLRSHSPPPASCVHWSSISIPSSTSVRWAVRSSTSPRGRARRRPTGSRPPSTSTSRAPSRLAASSRAAWASTAPARTSARTT
mmetsp:Transcript_37185/g.108972  ORF Transcript_37185/g.108972 Transcript_37185/m.108972 type:complete len:232 (-) Transcript_37185:266-961(-)